MKANEIQLGDFVLIDNKPTCISMQDLVYVYQGKECNPIPLTPEILEKNGFVYDGHIIGSDGYSCKSYNINDSQVWGYLTKEGFDIAFGGHDQPSGIILPYIHTLQHALRLCGLETLADNFKID